MKHTLQLSSFPIPHMRAYWNGLILYHHLSLYIPLFSFLSISLSLLPPYLHFFSFLNLLFWSPYLFSIFLTNFFLFFFFSFTCLTLYLSSHYLFFTSFFSSHIAWLDISHSASSPFFFFLPCIYGFHTHMLVHLISFSSKEFCHQPAMLCPIFSCMLRTLYRHPFCYLLLNSSTLNHYQASKIW